MFGQQWTIAQLRDGDLIGHISTLAPTNQLNVLIFVLKVKCWYFLQAWCLFRRQKKHNAALLFFAYSDYFITPRLWTNGQKSWEATYRERRTLCSVVHIVLELNKWRFEDVTLTYFSLCKKKKKINNFGFKNVRSAVLGISHDNSHKLPDCSAGTQKL